MKMLKIYTIENDIELKSLREISRDVTLEELRSDEFKLFLEDLLYTAKNSDEQTGVDSGGISAPQVGRNVNAIYILNYDTNQFELLINPKVQNIGDKKDIEYEGCLSVPNIEKQVERYKKVKVSYLDKEGNKQKKRYSGYNARTIQHELDHLNGILFIDKAIE